MSVADQTALPSSLSRRIPLALRLSPQFVNRFCARIQKTAAGGPPPAGLLFGVAGEGLVIVQAFRSFNASDSNGTNAPKDQQLAQAYERALATSQADPEVSALDLIGWYSMRPQGGLHASDIEFHNARFRRPNDVAVILRSQEDGDLLVELYTRANGARLSPEQHRWGALRLSPEVPVLGPIEITMRPAVSDDELKTFQPLDRALERGERRGRLRAKARIPLSILRPKSAQTEARANGEAAEMPEAARTVPSADVRIVRSGRHSLAREPQTTSESTTPIHKINAREVPSVPALFAPAKRRSPWIPGIVLIAVFTVFAGATFAFFLLRGLPAGSSAPAFLKAFLPNNGLALQVQTQGDRVLLTWNRRNAVVRSATGAILYIDDGAQHRPVSLDAGQTENGAVLYRPKSDDVTFRLEVHGQQGATIGESIRVLDGAQSAPPDVSATADAQPPSGQPAPAQAPDHHDWKPATDSKTAATAARPKSAEPPASDVAARITSSSGDNSDTQRSRTPAALPSVTTVPRDSVAAPAADIVTPAALNASASTSQNPGAGSSNANPSANITPAAVPPSIPALKIADVSKDLPGSVWSATPDQTDSPSKIAPDESASPAKQVESSRPVANAVHTTPAPQPAAPLQAPLGTPRTSLLPADFVPPRPIHQVLPDTRLFPPTFLATSPQVEVLVRIDQLGHVSTAQIMSDRKKVKEALAGAALLAARQWTFQPARLRGHTVASDHTIVFQFRPQQ